MSSIDVDFVNTQRIDVNITHGIILMNDFEYTLKLVSIDIDIDT